MFTYFHIGTYDCGSLLRDFIRVHRLNTIFRRTKCDLWSLKKESSEKVYIKVYIYRLKITHVACVGSIKLFVIVKEPTHHIIITSFYQHIMSTNPMHQSYAQNALRYPRSTVYRFHFDFQSNTMPLYLLLYYDLLSYYADVFWHQCSFCNWMWISYWVRNDNWASLGQFVGIKRTLWSVVSISHSPVFNRAHKHYLFVRNSSQSTNTITMQFQVRRFIIFNCISVQVYLPSSFYLFLLISYFIL